MEYSYKILKIDPRHRFLSVRYFKEGQDDFFKNFNPPSFNDVDIITLIQNFFPTVKRHWEYQNTVDESVSTLEVGNTAVLTYVEPEPVVETEEEKAFNVREQRNRMLLETDWMMFSDTTAPNQTWLNYRQALRDVSSQAGFPDTIIWPTKPE